MSAFLTGKSLEGVLELTRELGGNAEHILRSTGIPTSIFAKKDELIPYRLYCSLIENAAAHLGMPDFGVRLAQMRFKSNYAKELKIYVLSAKTLQESIKDFMLHLRTRSLGIEYKLETLKDTSSFSRTAPPQDAMMFPQGTIILLATVYLMLSEATGYKLHLTSVSFSFKDPGCKAELRALFRCPIQFDSEIDAINFPTSLLQLPIVTQDDNIHELLADYLKSRHLDETVEFVDLVRTMISKNLTAGRTDMEALTLRIPYKVRTIQKKLEEADTSYRELLSQVRFELAEALLLGSNTPVTYIAQRLCYQEVSAFSKAFYNHYGMSPRKWRQKQLSEANNNPAAAHVPIAG